MQHYVCDVLLRAGLQPPTSSVNQPTNQLIIIIVKGAKLL